MNKLVVVSIKRNEITNERGVKLELNDLWEVLKLNNGNEVKCFGIHIIGVIVLICGFIQGVT